MYLNPNKPYKLKAFYKSPLTSKIFGATDNYQAQQVFEQHPFQFQWRE